jgi:hypothetical protein
MKIALIAAAALAGGATVSIAQAQMDHTAMSGNGHSSMAGGPLHESGQSAFAAIKEAVDALEADPATDWSRVNIEALRQHLTDMNEVTLNASIRAEAAGGAMRYVVSGDGRTRESIQRMVIGHVRAMGDAAHWTLTGEQTSDGAVVTATPKQSGDLARIRALGLIGMMADGSHHQPHHWMLATGANPHT